MTEKIQQKSDCRSLILRIKNSLQETIQFQGKNQLLKIKAVEKIHLPDAVIHDIEAGK